MIVEKLFKIMEALDHIDSSKMEFGRTKYNYISEQEITTRLREEMIKNKVVLVPTSVFEKTQTHKDGVITSVTVTYKFIDIDDGTELDVAGAGQGYDSIDKALPKAMTAAYKVMQRQCFAIPSPTKEDPDTTASEAYTAPQAPAKPVDAEDVELPFGTHKGKKFKELMGTKTGRSYIEWLATKWNGSGNVRDAAVLLYARMQQEEQG